MSTTAALLFLGPVMGAVVFLLVADRPRRRPPRRPLPADGPLDWRATAVSRALICVVCFALWSLMIGDGILTRQFSWWDPLVLAAPFSPVIFLVFWPRLGVGDDGYVTVRNVRTRRFLLTDIVRTEATNAGIDLYLRSGRFKTAWAVQKSNFAFMRGWTTRADQVSDLLNERVRAAQEAAVAHGTREG